MTMMDNPPGLSCNTIQSLLSEYVDHALPKTKMNEIETHFRSCHKCLDQYLGLRTNLTNISNLPHHVQEPPELNNLWASIEKQLKLDKTTEGNAPCPYDEVFLSTYYDGEFSQADPEIIGFERHLSSCLLCNTTLQKLAQASEVFRNFSYQLEESIPFDLSQQILEQLVTPSLEERCPDFPIETVSAFLDQELSPKETMIFSQHLEQCTLCKRTLSSFGCLSENIHRSHQQLESQAPDCWPSIEKELKTVIPLRKNKRKWLSIPVTAAAVLLFMSLSLFSPQSSQQPLKTATAFSTQQQEGLIASVPLTEQRANHSDSTTSSIHVALHSSAGIHSDELNAMDVPTAEEYLSKVNHQEIPQDDLSATLGLQKKR